MLELIKSYCFSPTMARTLGEQVSEPDEIIRKFKVRKYIKIYNDYIKLEQQLNRVLGSTLL